MLGSIFFWGGGGGGGGKRIFTSYLKRNWSVVLPQRLLIYRCKPSLTTVKLQTLSTCLLLLMAFWRRRNKAMAEQEIQILPCHGNLLKFLMET
jgi:hypothetical protein